MVVSPADPIPLRGSVGGGMGYVGTYLALTAALLLLLHLTGHAAARPLLPPGSDRFDLRLALRFTAGAAAWVVLLFALAALGSLRPEAIFTAIALAILAGLWSTLRSHRARAGAGGSAAAAATPAAPPRRWFAIPGLVRREPIAALTWVVIAAVLAALFAQALRPIVAWDADVYHLTVPRLYLEHGGFRPIPFNVYSHWPLAVQLLFALAMTVKDYVLATALHFGLGVVLVIATAAAAARASTPLWGAAAAALLLAHPVVLYEIRVAYVDVACALFLLAALLALDRALEDPAHETALMAGAGIACGVLASAKLNGFFGALAIGLVYAGSRLRAGAGAREIARPLGAFVAATAVLLFPWLAKSWWLTGNPVYPLFYDLFGGPDWSEALARAHRAWQRSIGMGRSPLDYLLLPVRVLFLGGEGYARFDGRLHPATGVLLPLAVAAGFRVALARRALLAAGLWFVLWAATSQQMRFLIPVLPLLAIATAAGAHALSTRWLRRPATAASLATIALAALLVQASALYLEQAPRLYAALWSRGDELRARAAHEVFAAIDERLPADAGLLFVNFNRGFWSRREYLADSFFEASQVAALLHSLGDREAIRSGLAARGVTHVLVERHDGGPSYPREFVELLATPPARIVYRSRDGRFTLFELGAGETPAAVESESSA